MIGRQFAYDLLQAVSQLDTMTLQRELGRLVEAELVYQRGVPPQSTYVFKHALIQDAAYASLLKSTRQHYHQRIAQVLATQFPATTEAQPELLAHHYTEAGLLEDVATSGFASVLSHVHWVYCAYILLSLAPPGVSADAKSLGDKQRQLQQFLENQKKRRVLQQLTQIGGVQRYMDELRQALADA